MKTYGIQPKEIQISNFTIHGIELGERGRGRNLTILPTPSAPGLMEPGLSKTGKPRLNLSRNESGWVARISTCGAYVRGADGNVSVPPDIANEVKVVARGHGAFGDAGRTGTWDDLVITTTLENFSVRVKPSRGDAYLLLFSESKVSTVTYSEAEALDVELYGSTPSSSGDFVRL